MAAEVVRCAQADPAILECMGTGAGNCKCLQGSSAEACLGACWINVEADVCKPDAAAVCELGEDAMAAEVVRCAQADPAILECMGTGAGNCKCLQGSSAEACLGACWINVEVDVCVASSLSGEHEQILQIMQAPLVTMSWNHTDNEDSVAAEAPAASCGKDDDELSTAVADCAAEDPAVLACLGAGLASCECLKGSSAETCLGACWSSVEESVCSGPSPEAADGEDSVEAEAPAAAACGKDDDELSIAVADCVKEDVHVMACLSGGSPSCGCIRESGVQRCVGPCWPEVESSICKAAASLQAASCSKSADELTDAAVACIQADAAAMGCIQAGGSHCSCLQDSAAATCLGACWPAAESDLCMEDAVVSPAQEDVPDSPTTKETSCSKTGDVLASEAVRCAQADEDVMECIRGGATNCDCMRASTAVNCLGPCWEAVEADICVDDGAVAPPSVSPTSKETSCSKTGDVLASETVRCAQADEDVMECIRGGATNCDCMRASTAVNCLGPCWEAVEADICADDGALTPPAAVGDLDPAPACPMSTDELTDAAVRCIQGDEATLACIQASGSHCSCLQDSAAAACLGACWPAAEAGICEDQAVGTPAPEGAPDSPATQAAQVPSCTKSMDELSADAVRCAQADSAVMACIQGGESSCACLRGSLAVACIGPCWPYAEADLCNTAAAQPATLAEEPSPTVSCGEDEDGLAVLVKGCIAGSQEVLDCIQTGRGNCPCLSGSPVTACLGRCWARVQASICNAADHPGPVVTAANKATAAGEHPPQPVADAQESPVAPICTKSTDELTDAIVACAQSDPPAMACINDGGSNCDCLRGSTVVVSCMGACWDTVQRDVCGPAPPPDGEPATATAAVAPTPAEIASCGRSETQVAVDVKACSQRDSVVMNCLRDGETCGCLRGSSAVKCLGDCWPVVEASVCAGDAAGPPAGEAAPQAAAVHVRRDSEEDTGPRSDHSDQASTPGPPPACTSRIEDCINEDTTGVMACLARGDHECSCFEPLRSCLGDCAPGIFESVCAEPVMPPVPAAVEEAAIGGQHATQHGGQCDEDRLPAVSKACAAADPSAVACLKNGGDNCVCLQGSDVFKECVGSCWELYESVMCPPG